jgi:hypothetical protein
VFRFKASRKRLDCAYERGLRVPKPAYGRSRLKKNIFARRCSLPKRLRRKTFASKTSSSEDVCNSSSHQNLYGWASHLSTLRSYVWDVLVPNENMPSLESRGFQIHLRFPSSCEAALQFIVFTGSSFEIYHLRRLQLLILFLKTFFGVWLAASGRSSPEHDIKDVMK